MTLLPAVKKFIEANIEDIENTNSTLLFELTMDYLNDDEYKQFREILENLPYDEDIDEIEHDVIRKICKDIINKNYGRNISIKNQWEYYSKHYFGDFDKIIDGFEIIMYN